MPERFRAKRASVRVKKMPQIKKQRLRSDSVGTKKAPGRTLAYRVSVIAHTALYRPRFSDCSSPRDENRHDHSCEGGDVMVRRHFLNLVFGVAAGVAVFAAAANAAPVPPISPEQAMVPSRANAVEPAVVAQDEVNRLKPEQVRWYRHHWHHWHHRRWHRWHHWHHRHYWHRHHWHHRHW
jgi:hypothetical protein